MNKAVKAILSAFSNQEIEIRISQTPGKYKEVRSDSFVCGERRYLDTDRRKKTSDEDLFPIQKRKGTEKRGVFCDLFYSRRWLVDRERKNL